MLLKRILALCAIFPSGCSESSTELFRIGYVPPLAKLEISSVLKAGGTLDPSGVAGGFDCEIVMVGRNWATIRRILSDGVLDPLKSQVRRVPANANLIVGEGGRILLSATSPDYLAEVGDDLSLQPLSIPQHPWGGRWSGPVVPIGSDHFAIAAVSDRSRPLPDPEPWIGASLVRIVDSTGLVVGGVGKILREEGRYLTWLTSRVALGYSRDTLSVLFLSDGKLQRYTSVPGETEWSLVSSTALPQYLSSPMVREEIKPIPWLQEFDRFKHHQVSQVLAGVIVADRVYAIRAYAASWNRFNHPDLEARGEWQVKDHGLEIYDLRGRVLGRYALPAQHLRTLNVDLHGRIFLGFGDSVLIARPSINDGPKCPDTPRRVVFPFDDAPFRGTR